MENMIEFLAKQLAGENKVTAAHIDAAKNLIKMMGV